MRLPDRQGLDNVLIDDHNDPSCQSSVSLGRGRHCYRALVRTAWLLLFGLGLILSGCGSSDLDPDGSVITDRVQVADARFEGDFQVTSVTVSGEPVELISVPLVTIETVFGGLTVKPGCNTFFGSFTLADDGLASFTVGGGSDDGCDELGDQEDAVVEVLGSVTSWTEVDDGFRFDGPDGDQLTIAR